MKIVLLTLVSLIIGGCTSVVNLVNVNGNDNGSVNQLFIQSPLANAGPDESIVGGNELILDGTKSSDPQNLNLFYTWQQSDNNPKLEFTTTEYQSIAHVSTPIVSVPTKYYFTLSVSNGYRTSEDTVVITVDPR